MEEEKSTLRLYIGKKKIPIAILSSLGIIGGTTLGFVTKPEAAVELRKDQLVEIERRISVLEASDTLRKNTQDRIDQNVNLLCDGMSELLKKSVKCKGAPAKPE